MVKLKMGQMICANENDIEYQAIYEPSYPFFARFIAKVLVKGNAIISPTVIKIIWMIKISQKLSKSKKNKTDSH